MGRKLLVLLKLQEKNIQRRQTKGCHEYGLSAA